MKSIHSKALFRLSVLGPLASREGFAHGELKAQITALAKKRYNIPGSQNCYIDAKTIERWYYLWLKGGIDALAPNPRQDRGRSKLSQSLQEAIVALKKENPKRSLSALKLIVEDQGIAVKGEVTRSAIHRLLKLHGLNCRPKEETTIERRSYEAAHAGDLWVGDVMHGPTLSIDGKSRKVYLVSMMDDASRILPHSEFCLGETALDIEGVLKQSILKRGLPKKLIVDNGAAYRSKSLQDICARLEIRLIYSRPYEPQSKAKLERFHRTFRAQFLSELQHEKITQLADLNARLWAWIQQVYHRRLHESLNGLSPLERFQQDLVHVRPLHMSAGQYENAFHHRLVRKVRKDGSISYNGIRYEVDYSLSGKQVVLVVDPHLVQPLRVESREGDYLGAVTPLNYQSNSSRQRHRPGAKQEAKSTSPSLIYHSTVERCLEKQSAALAPSANLHKGKA